MTPATGRHASGAGANAKEAPAAAETRAPVAAASPGRAALTSFDVFCLCVDRAKNLLRLHEAAHGRRGKPEKYAADAHRAAIVLSVSALDAFVRTFVIARTRTLLANKALSLPVALKDYIKRFLKDDELLEAARKDDLLDRVEKAFRADFERRSFQGTKVIAEYMRIVGFEDIFHDIAMSAKVNEDTLCQDLDRFTERRHTIAHRGDYDLTENPPKENVVTKKDAEDCVRLITLIAKHIDALGANP